MSMTVNAVTHLLSSWRRSHPVQPFQWHTKYRLTNGQARRTYTSVERGPLHCIGYISLASGAAWQDAGVERVSTGVP